MSSELKALQSGLEALKQRQYQEAIGFLEKFCECQVNQASFKELIQAQMGLVKAYAVTGQREKAVKLCHQLAASQNTQVQAWAKQALISLSSESVAAQAPTQDKVETCKPSLTPSEAAELLKKANKALRFKRFAEAVQAYEEFIAGSDKSSKDYEVAQTWLVKAYKGNEQIDEAVTLCKQLTNSQIESTLIWAQQYLCNVLNVSVAPEVVADSTDDNQSTLKEAPIPQKMRIPNLEEFKQFCQQHLIEDLQDLETSRKQIQILMKL